MSILKSIKSFVGIGEDEDYEEDYYEDEEAEAEEEIKPHFRRTPRVVPVNSGAGARIKVMKPSDIDDSQRVAEDVKARRLVIFDVGDISPEDARRVVDFITGTAYGLDGSIKRIASGIFVVAPHGVDVTGDSVQTQAKSSLNWDI